VKVLISCVLIALTLTSSAFANTQKVISPFTDMQFGWIPIRGDFIEITIPKRIDNSKTHYLIEVEGMDYKDILAQAKQKYGKDAYKCQLSRKFVETMADLGVIIQNDKVNLRIYEFSWSHKVFDLKDVVLSERNQKRLISNTEDYCED
jgi:hypothetical protein